MSPLRPRALPFAIAAALLLAGGAPLRAQDALSASGGEPGGAERFAVPVDAPAARALDLVRSEGDERVVYEIELEVPGRRIPLSARLPLEAGQTSATLSLSVKEREGRRASSLALSPNPDGSPADGGIRLTWAF